MTGQWHPTLRALGDPPQREFAVPADPDRDGVLDWAWHADDVAGVEMEALVREMRSTPMERQHVQCLFQKGVPLVEVDPERVELGLEVASSHSEDEPAARELVDRRG